jgi:putative membrane protein
MGLILVWALPPIMLQVAFGADILWRHRLLVLTALLSVTAYLSAMDALAIGDGTWTIDPQQSLQVFVAGVLPVEELVFFLMTNTLIVFGVTLLLAVESGARIPAALKKMRFFAPARERKLA